MKTPSILKSQDKIPKKDRKNIYESTEKEENNKDRIREFNIKIII